MKMEDNNLWKIFNMVNNPDSGRGMIYCLKFKKDRLEEHRERIIMYGRSKGVELVEKDYEIEAKIPKTLENRIVKRIYSNFVQLSAVNEALEYKVTGLQHCTNLEELKNELVGRYVNFLDEKNLADAYNMVDLFIPMLVQDLRISYNIRKTPKEELETLEELSKFSNNQKKILDHSEVILMGY